MKQKQLNAIVICLILFTARSLNAQVSWQSYGCNFVSNDLANVPTALISCGPTCIATTGCTHFSWTTYNGGTCWMKSGIVSQANAVSITDKTASCGIVQGIYI